MELKGRVADHILGFKKPKGEQQGNTPPPPQKKKPLNKAVFKWGMVRL